MSKPTSPSNSRKRKTPETTLQSQPRRGSIPTNAHLGRRDSLSMSTKNKVQEELETRCQNIFNFCKEKNEEVVTGNNLIYII